MYAFDIVLRSSIWLSLRGLLLGESNLVGLFGIQFAKLSGDSFLILRYAIQYTSPSVALSGRAPSNSICEVVWEWHSLIVGTHWVVMFDLLQDRFGSHMVVIWCLVRNCFDSRICTSSAQMGASAQDSASMEASTRRLIVVRSRSANSSRPAPQAQFINDCCGCIEVASVVQFALCCIMMRAGLLIVLSGLVVELIVSL
jgi:hypothetical protein